MQTQIGQMLIAMLSTQIEQRNEKGFDTYKETLDDVPFDNYDWNMMAIEELLDMGQYLLKENLRLREEVKEVKTQLRMVINSHYGKVPIK